MRFMIIVKANEETESGKLPDAASLEAMGKFNEELAAAGVMLAGEGLHSSAKGARIQFRGGKATVTDGPFAEARELVGGFWIWKCASKEEALAWLARSPFQDADLELRQVHEAADFAGVMSPEGIATEERLRAEMSAKK